MCELKDKVGASVICFFYLFLSKNIELTCQEYGQNDKIKVDKKAMIRNLYNQIPHSAPNTK